MWHQDREFESESESTQSLAYNIAKEEFLFAKF